MTCHVLSALSMKYERTKKNPFNDPKKNREISPRVIFFWVVFLRQTLRQKNYARPRDPTKLTFALPLEYTRKCNEAGPQGTES